ncbi:MAG: hypothetical protein N2Z22_09980 [Turneriella sp.]|nr:hypothetical protein [Turneriella sp.]
MGKERTLHRLLLFTTLAFLILSLILAAVHPAKPVHNLQSGLNLPVVGLELAWTADEVWDIIGDPQEAAGQEARRAFALGTTLDFLYILSYALAYFFLNGFLIVRHGKNRRWLVVSGVLVVLAAVGDVIENVAIFRIIDSPTRALAADHVDLLVVATRAKWLMLGLAGLPAAVLLREEQKRGPSFLLMTSFALAVIGIVRPLAIELMTLFLSFFWVYLFIRLLPSKMAWWQSNA